MLILMIFDIHCLFINVTVNPLFYFYPCSLLLFLFPSLYCDVVGEELALVPYADLMNHNPYSNTYIDAQRSGMPLISRNEEVAVYADRPYKKFEQVVV